jgi:SAM-dependent methyltransferase
MEDKPTRTALASPENTYKKGLDYYKQKEFEKAEACFVPEAKRLHEEFKRSSTPGKPNAIVAAQLIPVLFNLASTELSLEKFQEAEDHLNTAILLQQYIPTTEHTMLSHEKYQKRLQKTLLYKALSAFSIVRASGRSRQQYTISLYDWYKCNSASLSEAFEKNFGELAKQIGTLPENKKYYIVSIGCGYGEEVFTLLKLLGEKNFEKISYVGIDPILDTPAFADKNKYSLHNIQKIYKELGYKNVVFSGVNACDIPATQKLLRNNKADLIIFRHPCFINDQQSGVPSDFPKILSKTVPAIAKENGETNIFITTYFENELTKAVVFLTLGNGKLQDDKFASQSNGDFNYNFVRRDEESVRKGFKEINCQDTEMCPDRFSFSSSYKPPSAALSKAAESKLQTAMSALARNKGASSKDEVPAPFPTAVPKSLAIRQPEAKEEKPSTPKKTDRLALPCTQRGLFAMGAAAVVTATAVAAGIMLNNSK